MVIVEMKIAFICGDTVRWQIISWAFELIFSIQNRILQVTRKSERETQQMRFVCHQIVCKIGHKTTFGTLVRPQFLS